jgi:alkanesulfonate monooxygenase SsuD/methylene tetrahydromethanopterin reductase-like flavin-dependent oxidoreductase (luciferase family)
MTRIGMFAPLGAFALTAETASAALSRIDESDVDHVCVNDHVSFRVGAGSDALINAGSVLTHYRRLPCYIALYLLPLRHPVTVARQLASLAELAPGRLTFGVGLGGDDRHEVEICGADPRTLGRRMDESLQILRALSDGEAIDFDGEFFTLHEARIMPAPAPRIPIIVGGRSDAAVRRAGRFGDGWLGIWVSPGRFATVTERIAEHAKAAGRSPDGFTHALNVWCGFGPTRAAARAPLEAAMRSFYQMPFEPFERYSPYGSPREVAEFLQPYLGSGCSAINIIACADRHEDAVEGVAEARRLLAARPSAARTHEHVFS